MVNIDFNNQTKYTVPKKKIEELLNLTQKKIKTCLPDRQVKKDQNVSLAFVGPVTIRKMNKSYRGKDYVTDVLSFEEEPEPGIPEDSIGEIIICSRRADKQAKEFKHSWAREVLRLSLHGYLHLLGYDHIKNKEAEAMEALELKILKQFHK